MQYKPLGEEWFVRLGRCYCMMILLSEFLSLLRSFLDNSMGSDDVVSSYRIDLAKNCYDMHLEQIVDILIEQRPQDVNIRVKKGGKEKAFVYP
jgi:hypothetical protein